MSKSAQAYQTIRRGIVEGAYGPGARLVADQLARDLEISKVPVREALRHLAAEGWVELIPNVGALVRQFDEQAWRDTMATLAVLEGHVMAAALPALDDELLDRAAAVNDQLRAVLAAFDPVRFTRLNRQFHFTFYARCPNRYAVSLVEAGWDRLDAIRRSIFLYVGERAPVSVNEHDELLGLVRAGAAPARIEQFVRTHRTRTVDSYLARMASERGESAVGD